MTRRSTERVTAIGDLDGSNAAVLRNVLTRAA